MMIEMDMFYMQATACFGGFPPNNKCLDGLDLFTPYIEHHIE